MTRAELFIHNIFRAESNRTSETGGISIIAMFTNSPRLRSLEPKDYTNILLQLKDSKKGMNSKAKFVCIVH